MEKFITEKFNSHIGDIMRCAITGHTTGIGKYLNEHFTNKGWDVVGVSRSTGYDLTKDIDRIVELASTCDLFINSACVENAQLELLDRISTKMVVFGSIAGQYHNLIQSDYSKFKKELEERCKNISMIPSSSVLYLQISMLEDAVSSDVLVPFSSVASSIDFWLTNTKINRIDFEFKLTPYTLEMIKNKFNASEESISFIMKNLCDEKKSLI